MQVAKCRNRTTCGQDGRMVGWLVLVVRCLAIPPPAHRPRPPRPTTRPIGTLFVNRRPSTIPNRLPHPSSPIPHPPSLSPSPSSLPQPSRMASLCCNTTVSSTLPTVYG
ncbi:hypothetical protein F4803DRAFT_519786, partial [Xylaria telfairii]